MSKPFMTYEQQIEKLCKKGLIIESTAYAQAVLARNSYFALIVGYKDLFKNPTTGNYRDGTRLQDIVSLYRFDEDLRALTLRYLLHIERHIKSSLSYAFCAEFGDSQTAYLDSKNYNGTDLKAVNKLINKYLSPLLDRPTDYPYIEHHKAKHKNVPLWVLSSALSFGTVSIMYKCAKPQVQSSISKEFPQLNERQLEQILQVLTNFRNVCAHGDRLFSYRCAKQDIPDLPLHAKLHIPQKGTHYLMGKRDYFAVVLALRYMLPNEEFLAYKQQLSLLIDRAAKHNTQMQRSELLRHMGLPENWAMITRYKR